MQSWELGFLPSGSLQSRMGDNCWHLLNTSPCWALW